MDEQKNQPKERRKRYEAPRILVREPLEAVATVCNTGMAKADPGSCPEGPISS
ncbi:MAG: hypothetical protein R3A78_00010 [Polyangiales bacterium]|nr:hypothetical protein [Myxococcales bacterium]